MSTQTEDTNQEPKEEVYSRPNHLKFIQAEVEDYAGISGDKAIVVVFPDGQPIMEATGDQGVCKTSLLAALKTALGGEEPANAINSKTKKKSISLQFEFDGEIYKTRQTTNSFSLTKIQEGPGGKLIQSEIKKPKDVLSSLIKVGVSPEFLSKKKSGEEQVKWIKELAKSNPELAEKEAVSKKKYDDAYAERTEVNRDVKSLLATLTTSGYYIWDDENKVLHPSDKFSADGNVVAAAPDGDVELKAEYEAAAKLNNELVSANVRLEQLESNKNIAIKNQEDIQREIERLTMGLTEQKNKEVEADEAIVKARAYIEERKDAPVRLQKVNTDLQNSANIALMRKALWDAAVSAGKYKEKEAKQQELNNTLVDAQTEIAELAKAYTPAIEGLEVEIGNNIDNKRPIGVYYKGTNISYLSESELWDLCLQVWKISGVSVVFIENSSSLGTDAINRVNWFAENGGKVFISTLSRGYRELVVSFHKDLK